MSIDANYTTYAAGALSALYGYFTTVVASPPEGITDVSILFGTPTGSDHITDNVLMLGSWRQEGGDLVTDYASDWFDLPAASGRRLEPFTVHFSIMSWSGDINPAPLTRVNNAFSLFNAVIEQIMDDYPWNLLGPSGAWGKLKMDLPLAGPIARGGWAAILECSIDVINAVAQGYPNGN
jgi:hypothetical protein